MEHVARFAERGLLFPDIPPDRFCRRAGTATRWIGKWVRPKVGITDHRFDPKHSWRHRFLSECREAGVDRETCDALTGHSDGSVSRDHGEFYIRTVFYPAIIKLVESARQNACGGWHRRLRSDWSPSSMRRATVPSRRPR
jgi:hypothetical protein